MKINIAIDGPSGAGKSSIAKILSNKLNYTHLDTGAMYRCVAYKAINEEIDFSNEQLINNLIDKIKFEFKNDNILLDGKDVTNLIRTNEISLAASNISKYKNVREKLVKLQKELAKSKGFIMDGRDIGTVVLKDAEVKIYLTANSLIRAKRRQLQNLELGINDDIEKLQKEREERDYQDSNRKESPLKPAKDSIIIDASYLTIDEVINKILDIIKRITND